MMCLGHYLPPIVPQALRAFYEILGVQGLVIVLLILFVAIFQTAYLIDRVLPVLDDIRQIQESKELKLGVEVGEKVSSPGIIYPDCRWIRVSKYVDKHFPNCYKERHIYVYCTHPSKPMKSDGCPPQCPYRQPPPKPLGFGAFSGLVVGGLLGLIAGPGGVLMGGLIGALVGHTLEVESLTPQAKAQIETCKNQGIKYFIHIDYEKLRS